MIVSRIIKERREKRPYSGTVSLLPFRLEGVALAASAGDFARDDLHIRSSKDGFASPADEFASDDAVFRFRKLGHSSQCQRCL